MQLCLRKPWRAALARVRQPALGPEGGQVNGEDPRVPDPAPGDPEVGSTERGATIGNNGAMPKPGPVPFEELERSDLLLTGVVRGGLSPATPSTA